MAKGLKFLRAFKEPEPEVMRARDTAAAFSTEDTQEQA